ncbi:T9SS type A sorting domain-containing protein [bacterium]|nr:T9SS type A sorting domain-containing protein [bacterium]
MKTTITLIALFFTSILSASAQVSLYGDDVYHSGSFNMAIDETGNLDPRTTGANQTWDFSSATSDETISFDIVSYSSSWNDANLVYVAQGDTFDFVRKTVNELITYLPIQNLDQFSFEPLKAMNFPLNFEDVSKDSFIMINYYSGGEIGMSQFDSVRIDLKAALYTEVDAWGKIKLPQGDYDVLRLKSEHLIAVKIATKDGNEDYIEQPFLGSEEWVTLYNWYAPEQGYSIAEYDPETGAVQYLNSSTLNIQQVNLEENISIENPITTQLAIENNGKHLLKFSLYDMNGVEQKRLNINAQSKGSIDVSDLAQGIYILYIVNPETNQVTTKKLVKN